MARLGLNRTSGQSRFGMIGHGSQFIARQKLWSFRRWTFVLTVPALRHCEKVFGLRLDDDPWREWSPMRVSLAARSQRSLVEPCLVSTNAFKASCHVRVDDAGIAAGEIRLGDLEIEEGWRRA